MAILSITPPAQSQMPQQKAASRNENTILVDNYRNTSSGEGYNYKGLLIHTAPGLHEYVAEHISKAFVPPAEILELGAGTGAMTQRLLDLGFDVTATDYLADSFRLSDVQFLALDLNEKFSEQVTKRFDGIVAIELIEHLENPRHFFRECARALKPGGSILLTTPNVDNPVSKAFFLRFGYWYWFSDADYRKLGHITPLSHWHLVKCAEEAGFESVFSGSFGDPFRHLRSWPRMRYLAKAVSWITRTPAQAGEIFLGVWRKRQN